MKMHGHDPGAICTPQETMSSTSTIAIAGAVSSGRAVPALA